MSARTWFLIEALLIVLNLLDLALGAGSVLTAIVVVGLTVCAVHDFHQWRAEVARDRRWTA